MASAFSVRSQNKTDLVPNSLVGNNDSKFISMTPNLGINFYDSVSTVLASISWDGISTTNPNGFDILSPLNMNSKNINNVNSLNGPTGGYDLTIGSSNQITMNSYDNVNIYPGVNFYVNSNDSIILNGNGGSADVLSLNAANSNISQTTQYVRLRDGVNDEEISLDMGTNTDQIPRVIITHRGQISQIYNDDSLNIESDQRTFITTGKALTIESINDNTSLFNPSGSIYIDNSSPFTGDGTINAGSLILNNSNGNNQIESSSITIDSSIGGTASITLDGPGGFAILGLTDGVNTNDITALGYTTKNSVQNSTHHLNFTGSSSTGVGAIQKTSGITCNPFYNTLSSGFVYTNLAIPTTITGATFSSGTLTLTNPAPFTALGQSITNSNNYFNITMSANITTLTPVNFRINGMYLVYITGNATTPYTISSSLGSGIKTNYTIITVPATGKALMRINYDGTTYYVNCSLFS